MNFNRELCDFYISLCHFSLYDHQNGPASEWNDYIVSAKRPNNSVILSSANHLFPGHPTLFDYHNAAAAHGESFLNLSDKVNIKLLSSKNVFVLIICVLPFRHHTVITQENEMIVRFDR